MSRFYKHVAPLGLNAAAIFGASSIARGLVSSPSGLGNLTPYGFNGAVASWFFNPCNPLIHVIRDSDNSTCRPSGALVIWCMPRFYKHVAPLGLKAAFPFRDDARHRRGGVPPPDGLGNPTPTDTTSFPHLPILTRPVFRFTCRLSGALVIWCMPPVYKHAAPLGLNAAQFSVRHPSQGLGFLAQRVG